MAQFGNYNAIQKGEEKNINTNYINNVILYFITNKTTNLCSDPASVVKSTLSRAFGNSKYFFWMCRIVHRGEHQFLNKSLAQQRAVRKKQ